MRGARPGETWIDRIVNARGQVGRLTSRRIIVAGFCVVLLAGIGVADGFSGRDLSLAVAYLVPITIGTVLLGRVAGLILATVSLAELLIADILSTGGIHTGVAVINDVLRFVIFLLVVFLLSALHDSVLSTRQANERGREFLSYAAHQLRTPVSGMSAASQALLLEPDASEREALLAVISRESIRAGRLVTSLLSIARLDQGEAAQLQDTDVRRLLDEFVERWQARWPQLQIAVVGQTPLPDRARLAQDACREIVDNLLDNACRHAESRVTLAFIVHRDHLELRVEDDGPGIPPGQETRAFDRFVSLDGRGGSGLGLPIARQLAQANGGALHYESGAFVVVLPWQVSRTADTPVRGSAHRT